jgi:all-trans-retinol 13,14-reductase
VSEEKVDGVITDKGEMFYTDLVLSNAGGQETFLNLVDEDAVKKKYTKKIRRQENALSAVQLYLGLDCPPKALGLKEHSFTAFFSYDHDENLRFIMDGAYDKTFFSAAAYSSFDDSLAPPGKGVLHLFSLDSMKNWEDLSPAEYENKKEQVTACFLKKAEKYIPGLSEHIIVKELGTPRTMHRYTGHKEGSIYGPSQNIYQSGLNRLQAETPISGLFLVGSSIYPGGGYPSVINSGYRTSRRILKKRPLR